MFAGSAGFLPDNPPPRPAGGGAWASATHNTMPARHKILLYIHPAISQKTYFTANCITLDGAVVDASGVASVVAEPNVVPKFVPVVLPRAPP